MVPVAVFTSPLRRARDTCRLAGFGASAVVDPRLREWDYGSAEGRTTAEIRAEVPGWSVWTHPTPGAETLDALAARVDAVIADLRALDGEVLLFAHAHLCRVLAARWCNLAPAAGQHLLLDPASWSILAYERETPVIAQLNRTR